jgi:hypothetical protein
MAFEIRSPTGDAATMIAKCFLTCAILTALGAMGCAGHVGSTNARSRPAMESLPTAPPPEPPPQEAPASDASTTPAPLPALAADEIRRVVRAKLPEVRACYDDVRRRLPTLTAVLTISWHIDADGRVPRASIVHSNAATPKLGECVRAIFLTMVFDNPDRTEADATWSFQFSPPESKVAFVP